MCRKHFLIFFASRIPTVNAMVPILIVYILIMKSLNLGNNRGASYGLLDTLMTLFHMCLGTLFLVGIRCFYLMSVCPGVVCMVSFYFCIFLGSGRCDFPMGSAVQMWDSVQKLFKLPDSTRDFVCHGIPYFCISDLFGLWMFRLSEKTRSSMRNDHWRSKNRKYPF